jgi:predicted N-acyltransferase
MQDLNAPLIFSITGSIKDIPVKDWDRLFPDVVEGYGYQKTLEESNLKEFSFGYILGKRNGNLVAIIPFFVMDFSFDTLIQGTLRALILKIQKRFKRFLKMKVVFLGSPTTEEFYLGISKQEEWNNILDKALEKISEFCAKESIKGVLFYSVSEKNKALVEYLKNINFIRMETLPGTIINIDANSLEDYIKTLSHNARKDLKKKLKSASMQAKLTTQLCENIDGILPQIYNLYLNNFTDADVRFETLTPEFFRDICRNMPGIAKFFITYDKEKIVAFNLFLAKDQIFIDKFVGFDRDLAHRYHLYHTTFCHNMDWCIKNGFRIYQPGATDYYPKIRLGAKLIPLYIYAKAFNPLLNSFIRLIAGFIEPKNLEPALKDIEELQR